VASFWTFLTRRNAGNVAPIFALATLPILAAAGAAVDFSNGFRQREIVQSALDAAAVAGNRINGIESESAVRTEARAVFDANIAGKVVDGLPLELEIGPGKVVASTSFEVKNYFLGLTGLTRQHFDLSAASVVGAGTFEVVMVLDNSGSMQGSKISTLRRAAHDLTGVLFNGAANSSKADPIKVGVVPFSRAVNIDPRNADVWWLDRTGVGTYHQEHFDEDVSRLDLFDEFRNVSWAGCVEMRPYPHDVRDTPPSSSNPATLFVPYFAPDEPDTGSYYTRYNNDYIEDTGGACECRSRGRGRRGRGDSSGMDCDALTDPERQELVCKYDNITLTGSHQNGVNYGPNMGCTTHELQPMTTIRGQVENEIARLTADGLTNITAGIMWGWRLLSPGEPFTEGRPYGTEDNTKVLIIMTDGANTYESAYNFNNSGYGAWSYAAKGHLGTTSSSNSTIVGKMNDRTLEACANIHQEQIRVYTVAFQVDSSTTRQILRECATDESMAFNADSNSELLAAFDRIGTDLSELRLER